MTSNTASPKARTVLRDPVLQGDGTVLREAAPCWLPESAAVFRSDDMRAFRHAYLNWFWGSYTPVYLGVAQAAFDELRRIVSARQPEAMPSRSPTTPTYAVTSPR